MRPLFTIIFLLPAFAFAQNVGIGTANPLTKLQVEGRITSGTAFNPTLGSDANTNLINIIVGINADGATNGIGFYENANFGMRLGYDGSGTGGTNALRIYDNTANPIMTFENGGELGIGTTTPSATVDLVQNSGSAILELNTTANGQFLVFGGSDNGANVRSWFAPNDGATVQFAKEFGYDPDLNGGNGTWYVESDIALATNFGNVGIGVDDPQQQLDVNGSVRIRGGAPVDGRVLTATNGNGDAQWEDAYTPPPTDYYSTGNTTSFSGTGNTHCDSQNGTCGRQIQSLSVTNTASFARVFRVYSAFGLKSDTGSDDYRYWLDDGPSGCQRYDQREKRVLAWGGNTANNARFNRGYNEIYYTIGAGSTITFRQKIFQTGGGCGHYKAGYMVAYPVE